jgi:Flp pilus assembly protein TadG
MSELRKYAGIVGRLRLKLRSLNGDSGSSLVELALCASLIFVMFFGIIEFGYALYTYQFVDEVAREMTRYAIVRGSACTAMPNCGFNDTTTTLQSYARSTYTYPGLDPAQVTVTNAWFSPVLNANKTVASWTACTGSGCNKPGNLVTVSVSYPFLLSVPFWKATTLNVSSSSTMVISQ